MKWRFIIIDSDSISTVIEEPIGWKDIILSIKRDRDLHGLFFEFSTPLRFYGDAYALIRDEYDLNGVEGFLTLTIEYQCDDDDAFASFYDARINFSRIEFNDADFCYVELPIEDNSCLTLLKSRQDQQVDLASLTSLDGTSLDDYSIPAPLTLLPKTIRKTDKVFIGDGTTNTLEQTSTTSGSNTFTSFLWSKTVDGIAELNGFNPEYDKGNSDTESDVVFLWTHPFIFLVTISNILLTIHYSFLLEVDVLLGNLTLDGCGPSDTFGDVTVNLKLRRKRLGVDTFVTIGTQTFAGCHDNLFSEDVTFDFAEAAFPFIAPPIQSDDQVSLYLEVIVEGSYTNIVPGAVTIDEFVGITDHDGNYFKVTMDTKYGATPAEVVLVNEALARTVESITDNCYTVYSDYFGRTDAFPIASEADGCGALEVITKGVFIRQLPNSQMLISFKQLFDGLNAIHNLGMGLETRTVGYDTFNVVRIEPARYFYDSTIILTCDKVPRIRRTVISDEFVSIFNFGYGKWEVEQFSGLDEFNTKRSYRTTLQTVKNSLSQISNIIASGYSIEIARQAWSTTSRDFRYDNDLFIICVERGEEEPYVVEQGNISSPANLIDPATVYNFRLSPSRNLLRWLPRLMASYVNATNGQLLYMSGEANVLAEGLINDGCVIESGVLSESEPVIEDDSLADTSEATPYYKLELWEFDYPMSVTDYLAVVANPKGIIQVRYGQQTGFLDCYVRQINYKPNEGLASFQLLPKYGAVPQGIDGGDFDMRDFESTDFFTDL